MAASQQRYITIQHIHQPDILLADLLNRSHDLGRLHHSRILQGRSIWRRHILWWQAYDGGVKVVPEAVDDCQPSEEPA